LQPSAASVHIPPQIADKAGWPKFLFFTLRFMVVVPPTVLVPAPQVSRRATNGCYRLPSRPSQPGRHHCHGKRRAVPDK
jgi:hypothetical protein